MLCHSLFAAAPWQLRESPEAPLTIFRNHRTAAAKQEQRSSGSAPSFRNCHTRLSDAIPQVSIQITPVKGGKRHFRQSLKCRRQRLFFYTIKRRIFFSARRKEDGGFEAAGLPRHFRPDGTKVFPRGGAASLRPSPASPAPRDGAHHRPLRGEFPQKFNQGAFPCPTM